MGRVNKPKHHRGHWGEPRPRNVQRKDNVVELGACPPDIQPDGSWIMATYQEQVIMKDGCYQEQQTLATSNLSDHRLSRGAMSDPRYE